jgi:hypothetical protein
MDYEDYGSLPTIGAGIPSGLDLTGQVNILENAEAFEGTFSSVYKGRYWGLCAVYRVRYNGNRQPYLHQDFWPTHSVLFFWRRVLHLDYNLAL